MSKQKTLKSAFTLEGKGLHTGLPVTITFNPAEVNTGRRIQRVDLEGQPIVDALAENVVETSRGTVVEKEGVRISTIEHAMAALFAFDIDNCLIQVNQPEFPILDGSAGAYVKAIQEVGVEEQKADKQYYIIRKKSEVVNETTGSKFILLPDEEFGINVLVSYPSPILNNQFASLDSLAEFPEQIASCRTFVFVRELEALLKNNLIKGGDLDNAIVIYDQILPQSDIDHLTDILGKERICVENMGYLNKEPLQFENEPARHKLLDVMGDLALIGKPIKGRVIATCPGHKANTDLAKKIRKELRRQEVPVPIYDPNQAPVLDVNQIKHLLPHRWPFLLVDKVIERTDTYVVGLKNVTGNETFFCGHFPQEPVMPGVLQLEAMAQTGGLLVLGTVDEPERYSTYFMKIDNAKFRQKVVPGDTLIFRLELSGEIRRGCVNMKGYAFVGDSIVAEADFMAQIVKNK
ncbi:MAG: bifunctional UDP-3-O-[3-hydroxymyristoyl] N-acetylglucosamine deacetylase/3-hydroxyacyl-ACP dehydratase [Paludibacteraceae bacterium]|nr:bifunctional UDP-3-O-[3-hydroxymyristoyl] N-acetylglucosamine deacetylase/3-hydroxyacyl-ACP dehydratase [Paludibacteraceae bacterium]